MTVATTSRRVLITGASGGIGAAAATAFAAEGADVWLTYSSNQVSAEQVAEDCRIAGAPCVELSQLDLRSPESVASLVSEVEKSWGKLHVLVNNGGVCFYRGIEDVELDEWDNTMETNVRGTFILTQLL